MVTTDTSTNYKVKCGLLCPRPVGWGGIKRSSASVVRPSVRLSEVAYIGSNSKTKRPRKTKLGTGGYPRSHATPTSTSMSKVKSQGHGVNFGGHLAAQLSSAVTYLFFDFMFCAKFVAEILFIYYSTMRLLYYYSL